MMRVPSRIPNYSERRAPKSSRKSVCPACQTAALAFRLNVFIRFRFKFSVRYGMFLPQEVSSSSGKRRFSRKNMAAINPHASPTPPVVPVCRARDPEARIVQYIG